MISKILNWLLALLFVVMIIALFSTEPKADTFTVLRGDTSYVDIGKGHYDIIFNHTPGFDSGLYDPTTFANCNFGFSPNPCSGAINPPPPVPPTNNVPEPATYLLFLLALGLMYLVYNPKKFIALLRM